MARKRSRKDPVDPPSIPPTFRSSLPAAKELGEKAGQAPMVDPKTTEAPIPGNMFDFSADGSTPDIAPPQLIEPEPLVLKPKKLASAAPPPGARSAPKKSPAKKTAPKKTAPKKAAAKKDKDEPTEAKSEASTQPTLVPESSSAKDEPKATAAPQKRSRLSERARRPVTAKSAKDALAEATKSPAKKSSRRKSASAKPASSPKKSTAPKSQAATAEPTPAAAPPAPTPEPVADPDQVALEAVVALFAEAEVLRVQPITDRRVFRALWQAHRVRALTEANLQLAVTASNLLDAHERLADGEIYAAEARIDGELAALFVDVQRGMIIAAARPAAVYLAGL